jgi:hypothetical protein
MSLRGQVRRLERHAEEDMIPIPQPNGPPARFPRSAYKEVFLNAMARLGGGESAPPLHPLLEAARNSSDPRWRDSYFSDIDRPDAHRGPQRITEIRAPGGRADPRGPKEQGRKHLSRQQTCGIGFYQPASPGPRVRCPRAVGMTLENYSVTVPTNLLPNVHLFNRPHMGS